MRHFAYIALAAAWTVAGLPAAGQEAANKEEATVITSVKLTFDYKQQYAVFEQDVVVVDGDMRLTADKLAVWFSADNAVTRIHAEGHVNILQGDKSAVAGEAVYEVAEGKITLTDQPRLQRGRHYLEGTKITYWRDQELMVCEPQSRLVIFPGDQGEGSEMNLFGD